jgi:hypothetical protein
VEYFGAGSRLVPIVASAEGSVDYLLAWYDLELQTKCTFMPSSDGTLRCLPPTHADVRFADERCTAAFSGSPTGACFDLSPEPAERQYFANATSCGTEMYRAASTVETASEGLAHYLRDETCARDIKSTRVQGLPLEQVAAASFVAAQLVPGDAERSPGMKPWVLRAADGAWEIRGFFDNERGVPCTLPDTWGVSDRCWPAPLAQLDPFEPGCGELAYPSPACGEALAALYTQTYVEGEACSSTRLQVYEARSLDCASLAAGSTETRQGYELGPEIDPEPLPKIERLYAGTGRLQVVFQGHAGVPYFPDPEAARSISSAFTAGYFDSRFGEPCWPEPVGEGQLLCLSRAWEDSDTLLSLGSASCAGQPLARVRKGPPVASCDPWPALRGFWSRTGDAEQRACPALAQGYELRGAQPFAGGVRDTSAEPSGVCQERLPDEEHEYFVPAGPVDPALVAQLRIRTLLPGVAP